VAEDRAVPRATVQPRADRSVRGIRVGSAPPGQSSELDEGYRGPQVCQLVGISYRQLDYWARTGLLRPSLAEAKGSGTKRRYSYRDLLELKVIKRLLDAGVSLQSARRAVGCLREDLGADLAASNLVLSDTTTVLAHSDGELVDLLAGGQGVFNVVPLSGVVNELAADIVRIERPTSGVVVDGARPARAAGA
jgi:DNA-binding transcriptional MerR regulator